MTGPTTKSDDQIAKDKEAVKAMTGAKAAMEAALRRINALEETLKSVERQAAAIGKTFGDDVHLHAWDTKTNAWAVIKASVLFNRLNETIKKVL